MGQFSLNLSDEEDALIRGTVEDLCAMADKTPLPPRTSPDYAAAFNARTKLKREFTFRAVIVEAMRTLDMAEVYKELTGQDPPAGSVVVDENKPLTPEELKQIDIVRKTANLGVYLPVEKRLLIIKTRLHKTPHLIPHALMGFKPRNPPKGYKPESEDSDTPEP